MVNFDPTPEQQRFIEASVRSGRFPETWLIVYRPGSVPLLVTRVVGGWQDVRELPLEESGA